MGRPERGQGAVEYLVASLWIVLLLSAAGIPERLFRAIRERVARSEEIQRMPVP